VVLDDNADGDSDVVGTASVTLTPLLESDGIRERVNVMKGTVRAGQIDVKIYWQE
jgi:hypothetical protein